MRILKWVGATLGIVAATGAMLYAVGMRLRMDGSGVPRFVTVERPDASARAIEAHREAMRSAAPAPAAPPPAPAPPATEPAVTEPAASPAPAAPRVYWTGFRGPNRDGHYRERPILTSWPAAGLTPLWRQPIGGGYASFSIANGRAFTIEQRRDQEVVAAYDVATGRELWTNAWPGLFTEWMGGAGPRATPTWSGGRLYALGALGELRCLDDSTGKVVWRKNILDDNGATNLPWGMAASPLVIDNLVVTLPGGPNGRSIVAYDARTGERRWSSLDDKQAYSSPMLVTLAGQPQILVITASRLVSVSPESGALLWDFPWPTMMDINASQPLVIGGNRVFLSSGYGHGAAVVEVTNEGGRLAPREVWQSSRLKNRFSSSVLHEGFIYGLDENILSCLDAQTGELKWKGGRYGHGQFVLASGHLVLLTEEGELVLVRATPEKLDERARVPLFDAKTWNHPAIDDGRLLVRNLEEMAAFDLRPR